jgi:hypothetical protein
LLRPGSVSRFSVFSISNCDGLLLVFDEMTG